MSYSKTHRVFKISNSVFILLTTLLLSGCWTIPFPSGDTPEEFTNSKKSIRSLLGSTKQEVTDAVGHPFWISDRGNKTYYIYEWRSDESDIVMVGYLPVPWPITHEGTEVHCILLKFNDTEDRLESYKVDTESGSFHSNPPRDCRKVFDIHGTQPRERSPHKPSKLSPEESAWKLHKEVGTYCSNADLGHAYAQKRIGELYYQGLYGLHKDLTQAYIWYALAANGGDNGAAVQLDELTNELSPQQLNEAQILLEAWEPGQCEKYLMEAISEVNE